MKALTKALHQRQQSTEIFTLFYLSEIWIEPEFWSGFTAVMALQDSSPDWWGKFRQDCRATADDKYSKPLTLHAFCMSCIDCWLAFEVHSRDKQGRIRIKEVVYLSLFLTHRNQRCIRKVEPQPIRMCLTTGFGQIRTFQWHNPKPPVTNEADLRPAKETAHLFPSIKTV